MAVTETLGSLGSWELQLSEQAPAALVDQLGYFGHVAIIAGPVDVASAGDGLRTAARYVGVCRKRPKRGRILGGSGMVFWLGDEDNKGHVIEAPLVLTSRTLAQAITAALPPTVTVGTIHPQPDPAARYTGTHQFQAPREVIQIICDAFGVEFRVNGDATVDVGTAAQLYNTEAPDSIIVRRGAGSDVDLTAVGGNYDPDEHVFDLSTRIVLLGQKTGTGDEPDQVFATGSATAASVPYKDMRGGTVKLTRIISESSQTEGSAQARAQLQLNRFNRPTRALAVTAQEYDTKGTLTVGDAAYIYDPDAGIMNAANQRLFRGQVVFPDVDRITSRTWPLLEGYTVAFRTGTGAWFDLTPWVVWESDSSTELVVGDLPKSLSGAGNAVQDRLDGARDLSLKKPKAPTGLTLTTSSVESGTGVDTAIITAEWNPVTQNVDDTTVALSHYELRSRPAFRAPSWEPAGVSDEPSADIPVVASLEYDVAVRAVSSGGTPSDWSATATIMSAADDTPPPAPSDPIVTSWLGLLRVAWDGLSNIGGPMPPDFNRVDVHVGTSSGFTPDVTTLLSSLSTAGTAHVVAPYGATRFIRLIAYDHTGNPSAASGTVTGSTSPVVSADIFDGAVGSSKLADLAVITAKIADLAVNDAKIGSLAVGKLTAGTMTADVVVAGQFATALTGARVVLNSLGLQKFAADNTPLVNITGSDALITGRYRSAVTGRRIEIGATGLVGEIRLYAPDGASGYLRSYTDTTESREGLQLGVGLLGVNPIWNALYYNQQEWASYQTKIHDFVFQDRWAIFHTGNRDIGVNSNPKVALSGTLFRLGAGAAGDNRVLTYDFVNGHFRVNFSNNASVQITSNLSPEASGLLQFTNGVDGNGAVLKSVTDGRGTLLEVRNIFDTGFLGLRAGVFEVNSDARGKVDVQDAPITGALAQVDQIRSRRFRREHSGDRPVLDENGVMVAVIEAPGPEETGVLAQEMPAFVRSGSADTELGVDVVRWLLLLTVAVQELNRRGLK